MYRDKETEQQVRKLAKILQVLLLAIVKWYSVISHNLNLL